MTSFLQLRASVPVYWEQDHSGMRAKPPISIARSDPYYASAAMHFERVRGFPASLPRTLPRGETSFPALL